MTNLSELRKQFPWPDHIRVFEAAEFYLNGRGPLTESGALKLRWGIQAHTEQALRAELSSLFEGKTDLAKEDIEECMTVIDKYLDKEERKATEEKTSLSEASLTEKLILLNQASRVTASTAKQWGISPDVLKKAIVRGALKESNGTYYGARNVRLQKLLENELKPGQAVYRVKEGKVEEVRVVGNEGGKVSVASSEKGSEVEEVDDEKSLSTEDPDGKQLDESDSDGKVRDVDLGDGFIAAIGENKEGEFVTLVDDGKKVHTLPNTASMAKAKRKAKEWKEKVVG